MDSEQIADQIGQVADTIERRGWVAGGGWVGDVLIVLDPDAEKHYRTEETVSEDGPVCLEGAVEAVSGIPHYNVRFLSCPLFMAIHDYLKTLDGAPLAGSTLGVPALWPFNDAADRLAPKGIDPKDFVIDTLRLAEKHYRSQA